MSQMRLPVDYKKEVHKSVFNLSTVKRTTLLPGMIIPIYSRRCYAGDKFIIDINALLKSVPLTSPLYGTFKLQTTVFFDSDTNYYGFLNNNNKLSTQELLAKKAHRFDFQPIMDTLGEVIEDYEAQRIFNGTWNNFRGSVLDYMGCPSGLITSGSDYGGFSNQPFDVGFVLTYLNIFRNYYANKQSTKFPFISDGSFASEGAISYDWNLSLLDDLFMALRNSDDGIDLNVSQTNSALRWFTEVYLPTLSSVSGGILLTTYLPDLYRNLLDDTFNNVVSKVTVDDKNQFTIDSLRYANKLQRLVDRFDISGGRFSDWLRTVWGVSTRKDMNIPEIIGASQSLIDPSQVTSLASTDKASIGEFGGNFDNFTRQRKHSFVASTPGRVMVCVTLVPMVDYSQGIDPELMEVNFSDRYFPEFEGLGYQKVPRLWYCASADGSISYESAPGESPHDWSASGFKEDINQTVGKQVAWLPMMTDVNRCHGEFGNRGYYENWVLKRRYQTISRDLGDPDQTDHVFQFKTRINQYISPVEYQYPFVTQSISDPNWFLQMALDVKAIRPKGKRFMPNLE